MSPRRARAVAADLPAAVLPDAVMHPASVDDVLALPPFLSVLRAAEARAGRSFDTFPAADQDALVLRRLEQLLAVARVSPAWGARLADAPVTLRSLADWEHVPVTDKETFTDLFTGTRPGMVVPIEHGGFEVVASGGTSSGRPSETVYDLAELRDTYALSGAFIGNHMLPPNMGEERPRWLATTLADYQMWSSGTMVGGVLAMAPGVNYVGAGPMSVEVFRHFLRYPGPKAIMGISASIAYLARFADGLEEEARRSFRVAMYGSGQLTRKAREDLRAGYPEIVVLSYFAATQAEAIGLQLDPGSEALATVPGLHLVEVVDDAGHAVAEGEEGELVVTRLLGDQAPLLRYKVGDRVRRLPRIVTPALDTSSFAFVGRSGEFLHIGDTQYSAKRALTEVFARFRDEVGVDLEAVALDTQWVNQRATKELLLTLTVPDPDALRRRLATKLGTAGSSPVVAAAIVRSLSVFNSLEANPDALARSGYRFGIRLLPIDSPELVRTEVGKVPLLVDRIDDPSPGPRRSA